MLCFWLFGVVVWSFLFLCSATHQREFHRRIEDGKMDQEDRSMMRREIPGGVVGESAMCVWSESPVVGDFGQN